MKNFFSLLLVFFISSSAFSQVAINTDGSLPHASAMLEIKSTNRGMLPPRLTLAQRNMIATPATGLFIYQTDNTPGFYHFNGSAWIQLATGSPVNFWTPNGTHLYNTNTGYTGIGVSDPLFALDIKDRIRIRSGTSSAGLWLNNSLNTTTPAFIGMAFDDRVGMYSNTIGWQFLMNTTNGNVGIGVENPIAKLHVKNDGEALILQGTSSFISFMNNAGTHKGFVSNAGENMSFGTAWGNVNGWLEFYTNGTKNMTIYNSGIAELSGTNASLEFWDNGFRSGVIEGDQSNSLEIAASRTEVFGATPGNLILQTGYNTSFGFARAGNVGIGTRTPVGRLHVTHPGPTAHLVLEYPGLNEYSRLLFANAGGNRHWGIAGKSTNGPISDDRLSFYNISTGFETMVMVGDGYVNIPGKMGIGTFNPAYKFSVNGVIRSKEIVVESGWADYVFDDNYKLKTIKEIEIFIKKNKHLPDIPTAKEISENGLQVGDMQKKMMEKIEEMTLYIIELKNEIDKLKVAIHK